VVRGARKQKREKRAATGSIFSSDYCRQAGVYHSKGLNLQLSRSLGFKRQNYPWGSGDANRLCERVYRGKDEGHTTLTGIGADEYFGRTCTGPLVNGRKTRGGNRFPSLAARGVSGRR
jgi:hypothetical protein